MDDTGAVQTFISQDAVDDIGIKVSGDDEVVTSYGIELAISSEMY